MRSFSHDFFLQLSLAHLSAVFPQIFALVINYGTELHLYFISLPVKDELSPQEIILSLGSEMMSRFLVCESVQNSKGMGAG